MSTSVYRWVLLVSVAWLVLYPLGWLFSPVLQAGATGKLVSIVTKASTYDMILDTLILGLAVAAFATILGAIFGWLTAVTNIRFRRSIDVLMMLPLIMPPFVMAMAWIFLAGPETGLLNRPLEAMGLEMRFNIFSLTGLVWVIGLHTMPYVYMNVKAGVLQLDISVEEAARAAGANWIKTLRYITVPLLMPSIGAGALLSFIVATEMFGVPKILGHGTGVNVLALGIFDSLQYPTDYVKAAILAAMMLVIAFSVTALYRRLLLAHEGRYATVGVRGSAANRRIPLPWRNLISISAVLFLGLSVILPAVVLTLASLLPAWTGNIDLGSLSFEAYREVFGLGIARRGFVNTLVFSVIATVFAIALGTLVAYVSLRSRWRFKGTLDYLASLPFALPGMALGVGLLIAYLRPPVLYGTAAILVLAFMTRYLAIAVRNSMGALAQIDRSMEEAARAAGARPWQMYWYIVLPLIAASVLGTSTLVTAAIIREMSAAILLYSYGNEVLSVAMYAVWESGDFSQATAIGVVMTIMVLSLAGIGRLIMGSTHQQGAPKA